MSGRVRVPPGGKDSMGGIFTHDSSPDTPRSPYKASNGAVPQATDNLLHFDGTPYAVPFKPSRRPSQTSLFPADAPSPRPRSAAPRPITAPGDGGMRNVMHHDYSYGNASPRKIGISPGGPTSIILG